MSPSSPPAPDDIAALQTLFAQQQRASRTQAEVPLALRRHRVKRIGKLLNTHEAELSAAVNADFGHRPATLTQVADLFVLRATLADTLRQLPRWMAPERVHTPLYLQPARAQVQRQPVGTVGIMGPWNYPLQLTLGPAIAALAAGNRVLIKPSEHTPRTSALLARLVAQYFAPEEMAVCQGGVALAQAFAALPFDHLFFTGSTATGRKVAESAARNLTPVTLELGGKSPCIIDSSCADLARAALQVAHGKLLNSGQTCIAPDYLLLPQAQAEAFVAQLRSAVAALFPPGTADYPSIINAKQHARLQDLLADASAKGARIETLPLACAPVAPQAEAAPAHFMPPTLVWQATPAMRILQEEIFGPLLPILTYTSVDDIIKHINAQPRPLALYWFGNATAVRDKVLAETVSGGVTVNDTLMHITHKGLPFGGVGESGLGAYHGETGFLRFTHRKAVFFQSRLALSHWFYPPYGARFAALQRWMKKLF